MDQALSPLDVLGTGVDLKIVSLVFLMPMEFDAVPGESAGDKALDSQIGCLPRGERSGGDTRLRHQQSSSLTC